MRRILISFVHLYRWGFSPLARLLFGTSGACRYSPTCSCYALEALERHGAIRGSILTAKRLLRCHPWGSAGFDPVPPAFDLTLYRNPSIKRVGAGAESTIGKAGTQQN